MVFAKGAGWVWRVIDHVFVKLLASGFVGLLTGGRIYPSGRRQHEQRPTSFAALHIDPGIVQSIVAVRYNQAGACAARFGW
jgi:hypothetical protein